MKELKPWLDDDAPPDVRRLLEAAQDVEPSPALVKRALASVGAGTTLSLAGAKAAALGASAAAGGTKGAAVAAKAAVWSASAKFGLPLLAAAAIGGGVVAVHVTRTDTPRPASSSPVSAGADSRRGGVPRAPLPAPSASVATPPETEVVSVAPAPPVATSSPVKVRSSSGIPAIPSAGKHEPAEPAVSAGGTPAGIADSSEARDVIAQAYKAHRLLRPQEVLRLLDGYEQRFPNSSFAAEVPYLRMRSWARLGDRAAAERAARQMVRLYPNNPLTPEAQTFLEQSPRRK